MEEEIPEGSVDEQLSAEVERLREKLGADAVSEAEAELREQLRREIGDRLEVEAKKMASARKGRAKVKAEDEEEFERFSLMFRIQHIVLFTSCIVLMITGLPLKFPNTEWAAVFFRVLGGVTESGMVHRVGAAGLIAVGVFHLAYTVVAREGRHNFRELIPQFRDIKSVYKNIRYFLGKSKTGARFARFSYIEKFDYWAVYWGMIVMIGSGLMLWFQDRAMSVLPKFFIDMAHEAHSDEALLATLAIIIWHFYNVHLNPDNFPMSWTWLTGKISKEKMLHHHPLEYEQIMAEREKLASAAGSKRRSSESGED